MDYKTMETEALTAEISRLKAEATEDRSLEELQTIEATVNEINAELEQRAAQETERRALAEAVASGAGQLKEEPNKETRKMPDIEIRNTKEYINAYVDYIKTGDDRECRALLTENGSGKVAVPELVYDIVKTAWEKNGITSRVRKAYLQGNLKVNFEASATGATTHTEGASAVSEETLTLGIVTMIPKNVKKWIGVSDEVLDLRGPEFLTYVYEELTYQIAKKAGEDLLDAIIACGTTAGTTQVGVPVVTVTTISVGLIAQAIGQLSDEAENPVVIMNKGTWAAFKAAQAANGFNYDPFEGLPVVYSNHLDNFATMTAGTFAIVGDFEHGALMNFPAGEEVKLNFDDKTLATQDLNRVIGRMFVASAPVANNAFVKLDK